MSDLHSYLLGQALHKLHSIESGQRETKASLEKLTTEIKEGITWAQRLIILGATWAAAISLNLSPDKAGETLAAFLRGFK